MLVRKSTEIALVRRIKPCEESIAQVAHNLSNLRAFYAIFVTSISGNKAHRTLPANSLPACLHVCMCVWVFVYRIYMQIEATHTHAHTRAHTKSHAVVVYCR